MKKGTLFSLFLASLLVGLPVCGEEETESEGLPILSTGIGSLIVEEQELPLPFGFTERGPLVALAPVVSLLGAGLELGPLGQAHRLQILEKEIVIGPDSAVMTIGEEIIPLSQPSRPGEGGLLVPLDLLTQTFGDLMGYEFGWDPVARQLAMARRPFREIPVEVDGVHSHGVTTLVLQFPETPRYRVREDSRLIEVEMVGDRLVRQGKPRVPDDPLVKRVEVDPNRIRVRLAQDAVANPHYVLRQPFRLVFDISRRRATVAHRPEGPRRQSKRVRTIVLDPGHGGSERGAIGPSGSEEKALTLVLGQALKAQLERRLPVKVVLSRNEDVDLPLETRTALANQNKADLFLSLHLNSSVGPTARGAETYFLSMQASDELAAASAEVENRGARESFDDGDYGLQLILWDLAQSHHLAESQRLANLIQQELNDTLDMKNRGVKQAPFRVLMGATMPSVLVELGFLSNPGEETKLQDPAHRAELVEALVRAIIRYRAQVESREPESGG